MTVHIKGHSKQIVDHFKSMLNESQIEMLNDEHFDELEMLIEASLGVVYSQAQHDFAKELELLAHRLRKGSSTISKD